MRRRRKLRTFVSALDVLEIDVSFDPAPNPSMGRIAPSGPLRVQCARADTLLATGEVEVPDVIKIDVEGAEAAVLRGARRIMERQPVILLATHGVQAHRECFGLLTAAGYELVSLHGSSPERTDEIVALAPKDAKP